MYSNVIYGIRNDYEKFLTKRFLFGIWRLEIGMQLLGVVLPKTGRDLHFN